MFDKFIDQWIEKIEGGYSNKDSNRGGETKWGISKRAYPDEDIPNLTKARAKEIYQSDYWDKAQCDKVGLNGNPALAIVYFDCGVNCGIGTAVRVLQRTINRLSNDKIWVDGTIGPQTLRALDIISHRNPQREIISTYLFERLRRYAEIIKNDASQVANLLGWINRLEKLGGEGIDC